MKNTWKNIKDYLKKNKASSIIYFLTVIVVYFVLFSFQNGTDDKIENVTYVEFQQYLTEGKIDTVYYNAQEELMSFTLFNDDTKDMSLEERVDYKYSDSEKRTCLYPNYDEFRKDVLLTGTNMVVVSNSTGFSDILWAVLQFGFPIFMIVYFVKMMSGQMKGVSEKDVLQTSNVSFDDIIGHEEIIDDVKFITELIKNPKMGDTVGAKLPKGILLTGAPGTGKTLLAKAIAHEAGVPFLYQNASGFIEMYVGLGARRVRDLFKIARANAPCILFLDEIDAIGEKRGSNKGTSENEQTINAILQEMDGFTGRDGIFVIAATNRPDSLDDALVRSGRFDRQIVVNPPKDWTVRKQLFEHYLNKFAVGDDVNVDNLSKQVSGFTGADIAMICNEASIVAVMHNKPFIDTACIEEAIDKKVFKGNRSKTNAHETDRTIIAYHESGHAVMSHLLGEPIARASIQSTVSGVGGAVFNQDKDTVFRTNKDFKNQVLIAYAGRASEEIKFGDVTTGASNDITQATQLMTSYIERFGFDTSFGLLDINELSKQHLIDGSAITEKLSKMSLDLYDECKKLLTANYDKVEILAGKLLELETVSGSFVADLLD